MITHDLLPEHRHAALRRRRRARAWAAVAAVYAAIVLAAAIAFSFSGPTRALAADPHADDQAHLRAITTETNALRAELRRNQSQLAIIARVSDQPDAATLLRLAATLAHPDVVLSGCTLKPIAPPARTPARARNAPPEEPANAGYEWTLRGVARTQAHAAEFLLRLEQSAVFDRVSLVRSGAGLAAETPVAEFEILCVLRSRGATR